MPRPDLVPFGWSADWSDAFRRWLSSPEAETVEEPRVGRVVRHDGAGLMVAVDGGSPRLAMFGAAVTPRPVVGDWIVIDRTPHPVATLPRRSLLRRRAAGGDGEQALVANVDVVLIVCGLDRPVRLGRVQRTLTIANDAGAESIVVLTKADTASAEQLDRARRTVAEVDAGLRSIAVSAADRSGLDDLLTAIGPRTVALIGESGAGKSTLVNALVGNDVALEGAVRAGDRKGRHTTTSRELHLLPNGGVLVDTPGIREVGVVGEGDAVAETFPDIDELASQCRFSDCAHESEPGCALRAALEAGELDPDRFARWSDLGEESDISVEMRDPSPYRRRLAAERQRRRGGGRRYGGSRG